MTRSHLIVIALITCACASTAASRGRPAESVDHVKPQIGISEAIASELLDFPVFKHFSRVIVCWYDGDKPVTPPDELVNYVRITVPTAFACTNPWSPGEVVLFMNIPANREGRQEVQGGYSCGDLCMYRATFVVERRGARWVVIDKLDQIMS